MKSVMEHSFSSVPRADIPRSTFNRSHGYKTTFDADYLIPVLIDECGPGDTFNVNMNFFARLATPLYPIMDNMYLESFFFFVPNRLVWNNWEKFMGAQDNPGDSISYSIPDCSGSGVSVSIGDLGDYMGLPKSLNFSTTNVNALPSRGYRLIWNEWFRDQNLQTSLDVATDDGPDVSAEHELDEVPKKRGKRHDYFTSCLPAPQRGTAVSLPLGTTAPVVGEGSALPKFTINSVTGHGLYGDGTTDTKWQTNTATGLASWDDTALEADLSGATAASINELRLAFQTQRLLERDARSGTRYTETILAHYGVTVPDFRLQRPEYLGGGSSAINVTPVAQTSGQPTPAADDKLGQLAAMGTASGSHGFTKSFVEHGYIIGLVNVRSDITYCQGLERHWSKSTRYDIYYPVLAQIGEQSVLNKEIWHNSAGTDNDDVFGYQERYAELRYKPSRVTGLFNVDAAGTLAAWHLTEDFTSLPTLGSTFIESNTGTPLDRAIAVPAEPHIIFDAYFDMKCARPLPIHGVPGNLDHF